ncbi:tRNA (adenine(37)-N6)-methyltransferase isoform X1 [Ochotona princeps]|uniref:tRNA (adenine(37)-N6)-methyltransferase isoform X1 n=2 Tax=Ochotona princeps TaxID=9978 RepID=UPI002714DB13|nr:tRNA (adenine(37)-N6)-methyltransferase isoform X1 [Ochotona princeps]
MRGQEEPGPGRTAIPCGCVKPALETGNLLTEPIGYLESCFVTKNGTPRQPSICSHSRACLKIRKSVFNNPEHSLMGLEQFSHVWILFVFHKNGHLSCKAKVQPPRLNGAKTGVFSTRSPHRPNAIGLTLAKLDKVEGGAVYLSGIDMIHGTPVLDIKPYIADYDSPQSLVVPIGDCESQKDQQMPEPPSQCDGETDCCARGQPPGCEAPQPCCSPEESPSHPGHSTPEAHHLEPSGPARLLRPRPGHRNPTGGLGLEGRDDRCVSDNRGVSTVEVLSGPHGGLSKSFSEDGTEQGPRSAEGAMFLQGGCADATRAGTPCPAGTPASAPCSSVVPAWVREAPAAALHVRFTPHAEQDLVQLGSGGEPGVGQASFKYFRSAEEAKSAIEAVLAADPRSVYRRQLCQDRLFFFTVDVAHVTCWFGEDFVEVLRIRLAPGPVPMVGETSVALPSASVSS